MTGTVPGSGAEAVTDKRAMPAAQVQWKNIKGMCLDFQCTCSDPADAYEFHLDSDDYIFGRFQCPRCGKVWQLGWTVPVVREGWAPIGEAPLLVSFHDDPEGFGMVTTTEPKQ